MMISGICNSGNCQGVLIVMGRIGVKVRGCNDIGFVGGGEV